MTAILLNSLAPGLRNVWRFDSAKWRAEGVLRNERENKIRIVSLIFRYCKLGVFFRAQNVYIYGTSFALFLAAEMEAREEEAIAINCSASCLLTLPKWRMRTAGIS